jgi:hypothetical protein
MTEFSRLELVFGPDKDRYHSNIARSYSGNVALFRAYLPTIAGRLQFAIKWRGLSRAHAISP